MFLISCISFHIFQIKFLIMIMMLSILLPAGHLKVDLLTKSKFGDVIVWITFMDDYKPHNSILIAMESTQQLISSKTAQMWKKIYYGIHLGTCVDLCRVYFALLKCKLDLVFLALSPYKSRGISRTIRTITIYLWSFPACWPQSSPLH